VSGAGDDWLTYDHDPGRTGVDAVSPPAGDVRPTWVSPALDGPVYAQPVVVGSTVIVATENNTVYAFDTATGARRWMRHLADPVPGSTLPCGNISPSGITGTPVVTPANGLVWVVTFTTPAVHTLWGLRQSDGTVASSRNANPPGANEPAEQQRGALVVDGSTVYVPYGGLFGDCSTYHGWLVGLSVTDPANPNPVTYHTSTLRSAIWAPPGPVVGSDGSLYIATGNGLPDTEAGDSDSVIRLSPGLAALDKFTVSDYVQANEGDQDLGSTSPALLPGGLVFQIGKDGKGYLLSASHLGGIGGELVQHPVCDGGFGGVAVHGEVLYISCYTGLYAVRVTSAPDFSVLWSARHIDPGPPIVAGGDVWVVDRSGAIEGYSEANGAPVYRANVGVAGSFPSPAASRGRLFVPSGDRLAVFEGI